MTFHWPPQGQGTAAVTIDKPKSHTTHTMNLIDTPGHADFTFEVIRSLRILDGAVCILDGVAGVEAQTEKVWAQANYWSIPRIVFVNKLDRDGAAFSKTVKEIGSRLKGWPAVCQIPWWEDGKGQFIGVGDAINLKALKWDKGGDGKGISTFDLDALLTEDPNLRLEIIKARGALVESLCEYDEKLLETWLEFGDDSMAIPAQAIRDSLRRCIIDGSGRLVPVFAGASFRNIGVQPLLDAVADLLPDPTERPDPEVSLGTVKGGLTDLLSGRLAFTPIPSKPLTKKTASPKSHVSQIEGCALAFKVVNDLKRGVLVYVRVYSGSINKNAALWNTNLHVTERAQRLLQMQASDAVEIPHIGTGQIGVIAGLKYARTGDTLISYPGISPKTGPPAPLDVLQLRPIDVPPPVFFAAVEPNSLSEEKNVAEILTLLLREDPSLHMNIDEESGQMLLSGMGELHLEIARDRLVNDFKAKATMGNIEISYRECVLSDTAFNRYVFDRDIAGKKGKAGCEAKVEPILSQEDLPENTTARNGNTVTIDVSAPLDAEGEPILPLELPLSAIKDALMNGAVAALARGPRRGFPLHNAHVTLRFDVSADFFGAETSPAALSSSARLAVQTALRSASDSNQIGLMEPVMNVVISCDEASLGTIVHDLSSARGGHILSLDSEGMDPSSTDHIQSVDTGRIYTPPDPFASIDVTQSSGPGQYRQVTATVPLKEMVGYLKHLRSLTGGRGTFIMSVDKFEKLSGPREKAV